MKTPRAAMHLLDPTGLRQGSKVTTDRFGRDVETCCKHLDRHFPFAPDDRLDLRLSFVRLHCVPQTKRPPWAAKVNRFLDRMTKSYGLALLSA